MFLLCEGAYGDQASRTTAGAEFIQSPLADAVAVDMTNHRHILVVDYDPSWPLTFMALREPIRQALGGIALTVEHVGSTAVPGLAAKPIIDIDVVIASLADLSAAIDRLAALGYVHSGDLGIDGREAFESPPGPAHHLYVCVQGSTALANHLAVRDRLRRNPDKAREYGELKKQLARQFPTDIESYVAGKTDFLLEVLRIEPAEVTDILRS
jgi:GrpB-like predicted nucleotidyltransferase (UPF0157 family)